MFHEDYFSLRAQQFVLEGRRMDESTAFSYLIDTICMQKKEANNYLRRLKREAIIRAKEVKANG